jgi:hypothetical protein
MSETVNGEFGTESSGQPSVVKSSTSPKKSQVGSSRAEVSSPAGFTEMEPSPASSHHKLTASEQKKVNQRLVQPSRKLPSEKVPEWYRAPQKINTDDQEKLVDRLYSQTIKQHEMRLQQKTDQVYRYESQKKMSDERIQENVTRMTDAEIEKRKKQAVTLQGKYFPVEPEKRVPREVIEDSIKRLHESSTKSHNDNQKKLDEKYAFKPEYATKHLTSAEMSTYVERLAKPKPVDFTSHPMYGATHGM